MRTSAAALRFVAWPTLSLSLLRLQFTMTAVPASMHLTDYFIASDTATVTATAELLTLSNTVARR